MKKIFIIFLLSVLIVGTVVYAQRINIAYTTKTTMTAPGTSAAVWCAGFSRVIWYFKVASISTSVSVALQTKSGTSEWTEIWADSLVYTKNGNYALEWDAAATADSLRFKWIAEAGGTAATIAHTAKLTGGY